MGFEEHFEGKGISSFTISQNGNVNIQKKYSKKKISISILTVIAISLAAIFIYYSYIRPEYTICQTKSCLRSAVTLINCMNETVEPCEDFYEFACGMFETNYPYYSNTNENSWMTIMTLKIKHRVKNQNSIKYDPLWDVWKKIGLNTDYLNDSVPLEIETILARVGVHFSLDIFFQIDIEADPRNSSSHLLLNIDQNLELNKYKERKNLKTNNVNIEEDLSKFSEYFNLLVDKLLNRNQSYIKKLTVQSLLNTTNKLVQFREEFSQVSQDSFNLKNDIPEVITLRELQEFTDITGDKLKFNWTLYLRELTRDVQPKVYEILTSEKANNYELLISNRDHLNKLTEMTDNIKWALRKMVHEASWMDDETKNATLRKLANTKTYFGYPNNYDNILNNFYENLNVTDNHIENIISISKFRTKSSWKYLTVDRDLENQIHASGNTTNSSIPQWYTFVVNGTLTLDENIADIVGLKEAYYAYRHYVDIHGQEPRLPGLERFSQEQLFFLGYANQYCHYDEYGNQFDIYDRHCPDVVRVREVLSLSSEFAKAWSCPIGFEEHFEEKGISSFTISKNGNVNIQKKYNKKRISISILMILGQSLRSANRNHVYNRTVKNQDSIKYDPQWDILKKIDLNTDYLNDSVSIFIQYDPRNSSSHSLLAIDRIWESNKYKERNNMKPNNVSIDEALPKFSKYFNLLVDKLLNRNQVCTKKLTVEGLVNTTNELVHFKEKLSKISHESYNIRKNFPDVITLRELQELTDITGDKFKFNWTLYLRELTRDIQPKVYEILTSENAKMHVLSCIVDILEKRLPSGEKFNSEHCFSLTNEFFYMATGYSMRNALDDTSKAALNEMTDNIKWAFKKIVHETSWMDDETKNTALRKLANMKTWLVQIYPTESYRYQYYKLRYTSTKIAMAYTPRVNRAFNYGNTGSTIGHELSHGYDNKNRLYNELGNLLNWWTNKSDEEYTKRANCLINRYDGIKVVNHNSTYVVNGTQTLGENIADIAGLKEAYYAYLRYVEIHGQEPRLPGLERYSQEQLFFLAYANQKKNFHQHINSNCNFPHINFHLLFLSEFTICQSKSCLQSAVTLTNCINETIEPCEDFYEFACGMFKINYPYYSDTNENSWSTIISLKLKHIVKKFLNKENEKYEPIAVHKTRKFYQVCLNSTKDQDSIKYDPLWDVWKKVGLNTDYLNDSVPLEIETILARLRIYFNLNIFFKIYINDDLRNSSSHSLLTIDRNLELNKYKERNNMKPNKVDIEEALPRFSEYFNLLVDKLLNRNQTCIKKLTVEDLVNTTNELVHFREGLSKVSHDSYNLINNIPEVITLRELQESTDIIGYKFKFNWTLYLRELTRDIQPKVYEILTSENANNYELLIVHKRDHLNKIFLFLSQTPKIILKMYILSRVVSTLEYKLPSRETFNSEHCFSLTNELFYMVTGYSLINSLDNSSKAALTEMTDNIKWAFRKMVREASWMDDETKNATLRKLYNMKTYFGYPNSYDNILNSFFENLNVTDNHIENIISITIFNKKSSWKYLTQDRDWNDQT
ncbi:hypothetical protein AGLY_009610 [Aphis glycines]|uniref:Peptidase M13 N-terminal domain-containing protein n=1 Tax=Aphis glycines TaxID=307491 RepID=A0A6G0TGY2_APHGL|nr:hypothetical protein AGLY_009610 [Aphis glycines]